MASAKAILGGLIGKLVFRDATVLRAQLLSPRMRRLVLEGAALRGVRWTPGDKVQIFLPEAGMRTYTPVRWDAVAGETELLVYLHGEGPGTHWAKRVAAGDSVQLFGPRDSLDLTGEEPSVVFGDETSLGLARTNAPGGATVLEVTDLAEAQRVIEALELSSVALVERGPDEAHRERMVDAVANALESRPGARLVLSGRAAGIQTVKQGLKSRGVHVRRSLAKAYWAPGKTGLD